MSATYFRVKPQHFLRIRPLAAAISLLMLPIGHTHAHPHKPLTVTATTTTSLLPQHATQPNQQRVKPQTQQNFVLHRDHVLGTSLDVIVRSQNAAQAERAFTAIEQEIARLDQVLSVWRQDSEISRLQQQGNIVASDDLFAVIAACEQWRHASCGGFDARLGGLIQAWEQQHHVLAPNGQTARVLWDQLQSDSIELNAQTQQIRLNHGIQLAPDGFAKGYIIDRALLRAREAVPELQGIMLDIGGDLRVWGNAHNAPWHIGVQDAQVAVDNAAPSTVLALNQQAVAVSGQGYRSVAGQHHIFNPNTGAAAHIQQCVVVAHCAADADAMATALSVLPPEQGMQLIEQLAGYEARISLNNGTTVYSSGWQNLLNHKPVQPLRPVASTASSNWPAGYQAILELNIPKIQAENYRAPYVSVWVTDSSKKLVRTLAVWGKDEKWLNSNYVWWRRYGRMMDKLDAVAKPSRQPGNYRLAWDGVDDDGQKVAAGNYIVHIETSREHGEHSYQTFDLTVAAKALKQNLPAQKEIGALKLNFQKVQ